MSIFTPITSPRGRHKRPKKAHRQKVKVGFGRAKCGRCRKWIEDVMEHFKCFNKRRT